MKGKCSYCKKIQALTRGEPSLCKACHLLLFKEEYKESENNL
jgi:hypothetical protein